VSRLITLIICAALLILLVVAVFKYIIPIFLPFIIALILSMLMEPVVKLLQNRLRVSRGLAAVISMVIFFGGIMLVVSTIILQLVAELIKLSISLPRVAAELQKYYQHLVEKATAFYVTLSPGVLSSLEQSINNLTSSLQGLISKAVNSILLFISFVPGTVTIIIVSLLATYFLTRDRHQFGEKLKRIIPAPWGEKTIIIFQEIGVAFVGYLRAQSILIFITTSISVIGLYLTGAEYALTMGLLIGFFDLIPVLGPATIYVPWAIWSFVTGATGFGIKITILYVIVLLSRQFLEAKIVSANLGLHPLATLAAMYAGLKTLGLVGLVLGPILLIAVQAIIKAATSTTK